ncbi:hypothetical protein G6F66_014846 [Rhizopus arrhizus]|nr:hypothetical protein G6F66_014846 [Rhizopus arrhizus]
MTPARPAVFVAGCSAPLRQMRACAGGGTGVGRRAAPAGDDHRRHGGRYLGMERADRPDAGQCTLGRDRRLPPGRAAADLPGNLPEAGTSG